MSDEFMNRSVDSASWQDYRASSTGMIVYYSTDPIAELPIREVPEEYTSDIVPEPNYETKTYGFFGCAKSKIRGAFVKAKIRYLFFVTKYDGAKEEYKEKFFITGYYRINKTADVKKQHIRYLSDYSCLDEDNCYALRADEYRFLSIEDAFPVNNEAMKSWDYKARITRQTRIILTEEQTAKVLDYLKSKPDITSAYIAETQRLQPHAPVSHDDSEEG